MSTTPIPLLAYLCTDLLPAQTQTASLSCNYTGSVPPHCQHITDNEKPPPRKRQNRQGIERDHPGMRLRIHILRHVRGIRQMPPGEAKDDQRGRFALGDEHVGVRPVC